MKNIVLIGMPGCGKSTLGPLLAELDHRPFFETDQLIVKKAGKPIPKIFEEEGEGAFRALETLCCQEAASQSGAVIATGGGVVLRKENLEALRKTGTIVFLHRALKEILSEDLSGRPLLAGDRACALRTLYWQRIGLYRKYADLTISNHTAPIEVAKQILRAARQEAGV